MRTFLKLLMFPVILLLSTSCLFQKKLADSESVISHLSDSAKVKDGSLVYSLPMTIFTIKVEMDRTIEIPGPYSRFAGDLLGMNKVIMKEGESWSINGITVNSHEEADPSEFYIIESNTIFQTNALALKKEGFILDLNPALFTSAGSKSGNNETNINNFLSFDLGSDEYFLVQRDTAFKRVNVDSTFIRIPYLVEKKKKLASEELAENAAKRLLELRDGKIMILTGETNVFPQNEAAINEINRLEKEYTELFAGKIFKEKRTFTYQIIPRKEQAGKPFMLFKFSEITGPVAGSEKMGTQVMMELLPEHKTKDLNIIPDQKPEESMPKFDKLFYRVPDVVNVRLNLGTETIYNSRKLVFQFGEVIQLPANFIIGK